MVLLSRRIELVYEFTPEAHGIPPTHYSYKGRQKDKYTFHKKYRATE
jgi:hypothetical protein